VTIPVLSVPIYLYYGVTDLHDDATLDSRENVLAIAGQPDIRILFRDSCFFFIGIFSGS